jgi:hypothetical protein
MVLTIAPGARSSKLAKDRRALSPVMQEYASGGPWHALFERLRAASSPTPEEKWILAEILNSCADVTDRKRPPPGSVSITIGGDDALARFKASLSDKDPDRNKRLAAFAKMRVDRCEGLREVRTTEAEIRALQEEAAAAGDPKARVWVLRNQYATASTKAQVEGNVFESRQSLPDAKFEAYKQIMQSGDPYALEQAGFLLMMNYADFSLRAGPAELAIDNESFFNAIRLVGCDLGKPCDADPWACATRGQCDARDFREHLFFYRNSPSQSQLTMQYYDALTRGVRDGDWSYFTVHRGPPPSEAIYTYRIVPPPR